MLPPSTPRSGSAGPPRSQHPAAGPLRRGNAAPYAAALNSTVPDLRHHDHGALNVLEQDEDGFFLMVEGGAIDWAGHANETGRTIEEETDFNNAVGAVIPG